jgi:hypothetical protein
LRSTAAFAFTTSSMTSSTLTSRGEYVKDS